MIGGIGKAVLQTDLAFPGKHLSVSHITAFAIKNVLEDGHMAMLHISLTLLLLSLPLFLLLPLPALPAASAWLQ